MFFWESHNKKYYKKDFPLDKLKFENGSSKVRIYQLVIYPVLRPSCCMLRFPIALHRNTCGKKLWRFLRNSRVVLCIHGAAWEVLAEWLRNPYFSLHFSMCQEVFPLFLRAFPMFVLVFFPISYFMSYRSNYASITQPNIRNTQ